MIHLPPPPPQTKHAQNRPPHTPEPSPNPSPAHLPTPPHPSVLPTIRTRNQPWPYAAPPGVRRCPPARPPTRRRRGSSRRLEPLLPGENLLRLRRRHRRRRGGGRSSPPLLPRLPAAGSRGGWRGLGDGAEPLESLLQLLVVLWRRLPCVSAPLNGNSARLKCQTRRKEIDVTVSDSRQFGSDQKCWFAFRNCSNGNRNLDPGDSSLLLFFRRAVCSRLCLSALETFHSGLDLVLELNRPTK